MDYRRDKKPQTIKYAFFALCAGVFGYVLFFTSAFSALAGAFHFLAVPMWGAERNISAVWGSFMVRMSDKDVLAKENDDLRAKIAVLKEEHAEYDALAEENTTLKEVLGRHEGARVVLAGVLVKPNISPYDVFVVDAGANQGVREGDMVLFSGGASAGRVVEVFGESAKVRLFSSNGEATDAVLLPAGIALPLLGRGGGNFELELPRDVEVTKGDRLVLPGLNTLLLGVVQSISGESSDSFKKVLVRGPANIFTATRVEILLSAPFMEQ